MTTTAHEDQWSEPWPEDRIDRIAQSDGSGDHYGTRVFNPITSSITDSQARGAAEDTGLCSDGKRCGVPPAVGDDAYCAECPNRIDSNTGIVGVSWMESKQKFEAYITSAGKRSFLGYHASLMEAACARKRAEINLGFHKNHGRVSDIIASAKRAKELEQ